MSTDKQLVEKLGFELVLRMAVTWGVSSDAMTVLTKEMPKASRKDVIGVEAMVSQWVVRTGIGQAVQRAGKLVEKMIVTMAVMTVDVWVDQKGPWRVAQWVGQSAHKLACAMVSLMVPTKGK